MIQQYIEHLLHVRGYSPCTARAYERNLRAFAGWMQEHTDGARWSAITKADVERYAASLHLDGHKPASINQALAAISGLYGYFKAQGLEVENPCRYASRMKRAKTMPNTIPTADIEKAISQRDDETGLAIRVLYRTGIRISELLAIRANDVDLEQRQITINGKGSKQRLVYMDDATAHALARHMIGRQGLLFVTDERRLRHDIFLRLRCVSQARQLSPHAIRHTFATMLARAGAPTTAIATLLGHERLDTTQKYINAAGIGTRQMYNQFIS